MKTFKKTVLFPLVLVLVMVWLAGCSAVNNVDLNKVLTSSYDQTSMEANGSAAVKLTFNDSIPASDAEDVAQWKAISPIAISFDDMKMSDPQHAYLTGSISFADKKIPYTLTIADQKMALTVEGLKQPILLDAAQLAAQDSGIDPQMMSIQQQLQQQQQALTKAVGTYIVKELPNPKAVDVADSTITVNGQSLQVKKIHAKITGTELESLLKKFLTNIAGDREGLKQIIGTLYDALYPVFKSQLATMDSTSAAMFSDKDTAVNLLTTVIISQLDQFNKQLVNQDLSSDEQMKAVLNDQNYLDISFYIDDQYRIRQEDYSLVISPQTNDGSSLKSIEITGSQQMWNHGAAITVPGLPAAGMTIDQVSNSQADFIKQVDKSSALYQLLDVTGATTQELHLTNYGKDYGAYSSHYTTMVPLRFVSEHLSASAAWNNTTKQVTITDSLTGKKVVLTMNSKTALVDGKKLALPVAPQVKKGSVYVPLRFLCDQLNTKIELDTEAHSIILKRHL